MSVGRGIGQLDLLKQPTNRMFLFYQILCDIRSDMMKTPEIGPQIKAIRKRQGLTLGALSETSGVSTSVLSELENSRGNPTFATLWSVAKALDVNLSELTDGASAVARTRIEILHDHFTPEIKSKDSNCTLRILGPAAAIGSFEWYAISILPGGCLKSDPHSPGTWEHLTVTKGGFEVRSGDTNTNVASGDTIRYPADVTHHIKNEGVGVAEGLLVVAIL